MNIHMYDSSWLIMTHNDWSWLTMTHHDSSKNIVSTADNTTGWYSVIENVEHGEIVRYMSIRICFDSIFHFEFNFLWNSIISNRGWDFNQVVKPVKVDIIWLTNEYAYVWLMMTHNDSKWPIMTHYDSSWFLMTHGRESYESFRVVIIQLLHYDPYE